MEEILEVLDIIQKHISDQKIKALIYADIVDLFENKINLAELYGVDDTLDNIITDREDQDPPEYIDIEE